MRLMSLLVAVGLMAVVACGDATRPEPAAVSDSAHTADLDATVEARVQATIAAQPTTTRSPTLTVISKPTAIPAPTATPTSSDYYDPENAYAAFDRMIADYDKALELYPSNAEIRIAAASAYYSRGIIRMHNSRYIKDYDAAIADYDKAMELDPSNADIKMTAAETYYQRGKIRRYLIGDTGGIDFYKAIRLNPEHADAYYELGLHYFAQEDYGNAIANLSKIIKLRPTDSFVTDAVAYFKRGSVYFALEDYGKSIADISKAIELAPTHADAYYRRGAAYFFTEDYDRAIADIGEAIRLQPYFGYNSYNFDYNAMPPPQFTGEYFYGSKYDDAIWAYEDAIKLKPSDAGSYFRRGYVYFLMYNYVRGMTDIDKAIEMNPNHADAYYLRGVACIAKEGYDKSILEHAELWIIESLRSETGAYDFMEIACAVKEGKGDYDETIAELDEAIELNPDDADAYLRRGYAHFLMHDYASAKADLDKAAFELSEHHFEEYYLLGEACTNREDYDRAMSEVTQMIEAGESYFLGVALGVGCAARDDYDGAIADLDKTIELKPYHAGAYYFRGLAYALEEDYDKAIADFRKAIKIDPTNVKAKEALELAQKSQ